MNNQQTIEGNTVNTLNIDQLTQELVSREVRACASYLVSDLCNAGLYSESCSFGELYSDILVQDDCLAALEDSGVTQSEDEYGATIWTNEDGEHCAGSEYDACDFFGIEPYLNEALEHWIVSDWLADKLKQHGEMVNKDVHGLTIWGRTTSGQAIYCDYVIRKIVKELHGL